MTYVSLGKKTYNFKERRISDDGHLAAEKTRTTVHRALWRALIIMARTLIFKRTTVRRALWRALNTKDYLNIFRGQWICLQDRGHQNVIPGVGRRLYLRK